MEKKTPEKRKLEPSSPTAEPEEAESESTKPEKADATSMKPEKADATSMKPEKADAKKASLPAPSREAWKDMRYQMQVLQKQKKSTHLHSQWAGCKTQLAKRQFYYEIFLLDPNVAQKTVHKESLQRQTAQNTVVSGWMTKWEIAELEGANKHHPLFETLADAAVEGLEERGHEIPAWAKAVKQYSYSKKLHSRNLAENSSQVMAKQKVENLEPDIFQQVEGALKVEPEQGQVVLGAPKPKPGAPSASEDIWETYKKTYASLKKAVTTFCNGRDKLAALKTSLEEAQDTVKQDPQHAASIAVISELIATQPEKAKWQDVLKKFPASLDKATEAEVKTREQEAAEQKVLCDADIKSLNKAVSPTRMWAKNNNLLTGNTA